MGSREGRKERIDGAQRILGNETTLYDTLMLDTCHTSVKTHRNVINHGTLHHKKKKKLYQV